MLSFLIAFAYFVYICLFLVLVFCFMIYYNNTVAGVVLGGGCGARVKYMLFFMCKIKVDLNLHKISWQLLQICSLQTRRGQLNSLQHQCQCLCIFSSIAGRQAHVSVSTLVCFMKTSPWKILHLLTSCSLSRGGRLAVSPLTILQQSGLPPLPARLCWWVCSAYPPKSTKQEGLWLMLCTLYKHTLP